MKAFSKFYKKKFYLKMNKTHLMLKDISYIISKALYLRLILKALSYWLMKII